MTAMSEVRSVNEYVGRFVGPERVDEYLSRVEGERDYLMDRVLALANYDERKDLIGRSSTAMLVGALTWHREAVQRDYRPAQAGRCVRRGMTLRSRARADGRREGPAAS